MSELEKKVDPFPEHTKIRAVSEESNTIAAFLEWLRSAGYTICETYNRPTSLRDGEYMQTSKGIEQLLAQYFNIDLKKIDAEKDAILEVIRAPNKTSLEPDKTVVKKGRRSA